MILVKRNWKFMVGVAMIWTLNMVAGCTALTSPDPDVSPFMERSLTTPQTVKAPVVHTVRFEGESLAIISQWYTGEAKNWHMLAQINSEANPFQIPIGHQIIIPPYLVSTMDPMPRLYVQRYYKANPPRPGKTADVKPAHLESKTGDEKKSISHPAKEKNKSAQRTKPKVRPALSGKKKASSSLPLPPSVIDKKESPQPYLPILIPELEPVGPKL